MLTINDLKPGTIFIFEGVPYEALAVKHSHLGRGGAVVETKIRNLKTGAVISRNFKPADTFEEAELEKQKIEFLYSHRGEFWFIPYISTEKGAGFAEAGNPKERFMLKEETLPENVRKFIKPRTQVEAWKIGDQILTIRLPIKVDLTVIEAPPGVRGDTAQGGSKTVKLETGATIQVPLFINEGDIIRVNTETGEYVERVEKAKS